MKVASINESVGQNIKTIRHNKGLSQEELASLAGLNKSYIGQIERAEKNITLKTLDKICNALSIKIVKIIVFDGKEDQ